jgi:hypothetical protein
MAINDASYIWAILFLPFWSFMIWAILSLDSLFNKENRGKLSRTIVSFIMAISFIVFGVVGAFVYLTHVDILVFFIIMFTIGCIVLFFSLRTLLKKMKTLKIKS